MPAFEVLVFASDFEFWIGVYEHLIVVDIPTQSLHTILLSIDFQGVN